VFGEGTFAPRPQQGLGESRPVPHSVPVCGDQAAPISPDLLRPGSPNQSRFSETRKQPHFRSTLAAIMPARQADTQMPVTLPNIGAGQELIHPFHYTKHATTDS
jgi:hypothetical protein